MMTKDEAIHKALKVLNCLNNDRVYETAWVKGAINACEEALEQPAQEPVGWIVFDVYGNGNYKPSDINTFYTKQTTVLQMPIPLYTQPHQWQGLTDDEICDLWTLSDKDLDGIDLGYTTQQHYFAALVEQALKEKNT
jgi:hypothetical protein